MYTLLRLREQTVVDRRELVALVGLDRVGDGLAGDARPEEVGDGRADAVGFDEEGVVAVLGVDDVVGDVDSDCSTVKCQSPVKETRSASPSKAASASASPSYPEARS